MREREEALVRGIEELVVEEDYVLVEAEVIPESTEISPTSSMPTTTEAFPTDSTMILYSSHFNATTSHLALPSKSLSTLPLPQNGAPPLPSSPSYLPLESLDLSRNHLSLLPLHSIITWNWSGIRKMNLSQNKISGIDWLFDGKLSGLVELNLSGNSLGDEVEMESGGEKGSIFDGLSILAPALEELDLSYNDLTFTSSINSLLLTNGRTKRKKGLRTLKLNGNRIGNLEGLVEAATSIKDMGMRAVGWECEVLDLSDNEIGRVRLSLLLVESDDTDDVSTSVAVQSRPSSTFFGYPNWG